MPYGGLPDACRHRAPCKPFNVIVTSVSLDGSTVLVIKTDMTYTVTHQTTHILPPAGTQNALGEGHKKASTQQAARRTGVLARCRRAHCARFERWRSQKHRWWPSAGVSGGGRDLTLRADDPTSRGTTQPHHNPTQHETTQLKARFSSWALCLSPGRARRAARKKTKIGATYLLRGPLGRSKPDLPTYLKTPYRPRSRNPGRPSQGGHEQGASAPPST